MLPYRNFKHDGLGAFLLNLSAVISTVLKRNYFIKQFFVNKKTYQANLFIKSKFLQSYL